MPKLPDLILSRSHRFATWLWPLMATVTAVLLWAATLAGANAERERAHAAALKEARSHARAYERYITRSTGQMDQVTMQLKQSWEQSRNPSLLEDMRSEGMFTDSAFVSVSIVGRDGAILSSTRPLAGAGKISGYAFFTHHRDHISTALQINSAPWAQAGDQDIVLFTRRLDTVHDEFDGMVLMAVDARYFTAFFGQAMLGSEGLVAVAGLENPLRLELGSANADASGPLLLPGAAIWNSESGERMMRGADAFADGVDRMLVWRQSDAYPLVALVGLSQREAMAGAELYWQESRNNAVLATILLALLAALATAVSRAAARRGREQHEVQLAYRTATESANDGFYMVAAVKDRNGGIVDFEVVDCNERGAYFYGMPRAELLGCRLSTVDSMLFGQDLMRAYHAAMATGFHEDERAMPRDSRVNITWGHRRMVRVGDGLAVTLQDISHRKAHDEELQRLANQDALTGLPNRHWFMQFMPEALARARDASSGLALLFIDLDEFKHVNDVHGHGAGDQLLKAAAQRMLSLLRPSDHVVRFGGDEFIAVLAPCEGREQVAAVAQRMVTAFAAPFSVGGEMQAVGASVGISMYPHDGEDAATLIRHSDIAMYSGKSEGKGQYRFFEPELSSMVHKRTRLKNSLVEAIERDELLLYYQPRVDTASGVMCSMEALLRWQHPAHGMIPPGDFIPLAEDSGLILRIGELVIDKACRQLSAWRAQGLPLVPVSINVSPRQFARGSVHRRLAAALDLHQIPPALLEVEITESAMMGDQEDILAELDAIRALGVKLHVDDFGTGYSSLSQLQRLKMDVLKVDRAFTAELGNSREGKVFFQAIVSMAHALGMTVVAEGVETAEQLDILKSLNCNEVQGYFIARPMAARDMPTLMKQGCLISAPVPPAGRLPAAA